MAKIPNLKSPHDDTQLNVLNLMIDVLNRLGQSVQSLVANGQLTPAQFTQLIQEINGLISKGQISVHDIDKNKGLLDQSFLSPELLKQIAGTAPVLSSLADGVVTSGKIANNSVAPNKTTFFNIGNDIFDGTYWNGILVRDSNGTVLRPVYNYDNIQGKVAVLPITPGKSYTIQVDPKQTTYLRVGVDRLGRTEKFATYPTTNKLDRVIESRADLNIESVSFQAQANENFVYIYVSGEGVEAPMTVRETVIDKGYIPPLNSREVSPQQTSFFNTSGSEKNLFKGNYTDGLLVHVAGTDGSELYLRQNYSPWRGKTAIIPVKPNTSYAAKLHDNGTQRADSFRIGLMNSSPSFYTSNSASAKVDDFVADIRDGAVKQKVFTTKANTKFAVIYVASDGNEPPLMVEEGSTFSNTTGSAFIPLHYLDVNGIQGLIGSSGVGSGNNLFDGNYTDGILFREASGTILRPVYNFDDLQGKVAVVPITPGKRYRVKADTSQSSNFRFGTASSNDLWATHPSTKQLTRVVHNGLDDSIDTVEFTAQSGENYIYVYVSGYGVNVPLSVEEIEGGSNVASSNKDSRFNFAGKFNETYQEPPLKNYYSSPATMSPAQFHAKFKTLIDKYPEIASRTKLGEDKWGYPIYKYEIKPVDYHEATYWNQNPGNEGPTQDMAKIMIISGIHGREKNVSYAIYHMFESILENPNDLEVFETMKMHIHIVTIPLITSSGFIDVTYENRDGINVSPNFPPKETNAPIEAQIVLKEINNNKDMDLYIDYHNMQARHDLIGFSMTQDPMWKHATLNAYRSVGRMWQKRDSNMPQALNHRWAYSTGTGSGSSVQYVQEELGVPATLIEVPLSSQWHDEGLHGANITRLGVDILVNVIFAGIRSKQ